MTARSMRMLTSTYDPITLATRIRTAAPKLLMLDYDGCLAPHRPERDQARPYPGVMDLLARIRSDGGTTIVIISGRSVDDLLPLLAMDDAPEIWGAHGWERWRAGTCVRAQVPREAEILLHRGSELLSSQGWEEQYERKVASLAVHLRGLDDERRTSLERSIAQLADLIARDGTLQAIPFDGGVEFRIPGTDKGTAVQTLLAEHLDTEFAAYLGDDLTDEDAFRALEGRGLRVLVRPQFRRTRADLHLHPPEELLAFLSLWTTS
jgi:trehalose 6-phosphate phosphatase